MIKKVITLIFDGLGDRPIADFDGRTPLEAAHTPNLDHVASKSICGLMHTLGRGLRPGSDVSHLEIFGYPISQYYFGRGPIEVAGLGIKLQPGDVALRGNFGTVDGKGMIVDRRAGRIRDVDEFAAAIDGIKIDGIEFIVKPGTAHRAGVVMRGPGLSSAVTDADPHEEGRRLQAVSPVDDSAEAQFTADVMNGFLDKVYRILDDLPANKERIAKGLLPANYLLIRGAGMMSQVPDFHERYGFKACCIAGGGLYKGIGAYLGMDVVHVEGATALPDSNLPNKFSKAMELMPYYDFMFMHIKASDSLAEDGDFEGKRSFIELADKAVYPFRDLPDDTLLVVTADHSTACELKAHSADPVPIMFSNPSARVDDVTAFNERACAAGGIGHMEGKDLMPEVMNLCGRLHLIGA